MSFIRDLENRVFASVRDARAHSVGDQALVPWNTESLKRHKYVLLTSFRRKGNPVNTPVWFGIAGGRIYVRSGAQDGKVKRIRHTERVLVTPCGARGAPLGKPMEGVARILEAPDELARAEAALRQHYGFGRKLYRLVRRRIDVAYIEIGGAQS